MRDNQELTALLDMIETKAEKIMKEDPYQEYREAVEWAEKRNLIKDLPKEEIQRRMDNNEWRKVNKIIIRNENRNNDSDSSSHSG